MANKLCFTRNKSAAQFYLPKLPGNNARLLMGFLIMYISYLVLSTLLRLDNQVDNKFQQVQTVTIKLERWWYLCKSTFPAITNYNEQVPGNYFR